MEREIRAIENSARVAEFPHLTIYEKAFIYKYSEDGYESVNETLRVSKGKINTDFGKLLNSILNKLANFEDLVYRSVNLTNTETNRYISAFENDTIIKEHAFVSTSKVRLNAMAYGGNTLFVIFSKSGKEIEKIAKFGIFGASNENEVLFKPNRNFRVLDIEQKENHLLITMEEV
ncbi:ADP-ribosyltransferase [Arachidicoccus ginsenosidimutans]|uniref:ADP-ribosyltransferase n=1 Tax=Arachidicoccus sp. BS20 TaxID=1850526 RepID=UPI001E438201|nr:ADP-ribosyltransferase [Arachidicoccus sp. BS20]